MIKYEWYVKLLLGNIWAQDGIFFMLYVYRLHPVFSCVFIWQGGGFSELTYTLAQFAQICRQKRKD